MTIIHPYRQQVSSSLFLCDTSFTTEPKRLLLHGLLEKKNLCFGNCHFYQMTDSVKVILSEYGGTNDS